MALEHRHPTGEPGTGAVIGTWRHRTEQDLVADVADVAAAETVKTAEAEVGAGTMVQPPTPHQDVHKTWGGDQNGREGGRSD